MIIYGKNPVLEALKNPKQIKKVYISERSKGLSKLLEDKHLPYQYMATEQMRKMFGEHHQGIVAEINDYQYTDFNELLNNLKNQQNVTLALLDGLEDPHNLGAIMRTADAAKIDGLIIPKNRSVGLNSTVAKVSTGAIEYVKVSQVTNLVQTINKLKEAGFWIIGLDMDGAVDYREQSYDGKIAIVIGSEGFGISRLVKENCDLSIYIPMYGHINSLNASVSASLIFYEVLRKRPN